MKYILFWVCKFFLEEKIEKVIYFTRNVCLKREFTLLNQLPNLVLLNSHLNYMVN